MKRQQEGIDVNNLHGKGCLVPETLTPAFLLSASEPSVNKKDTQNLIASLSNHSYFSFVGSNSFFT